MKPDPSIRLALLEDDETLLFVLGRALQKPGHSVTTLASLADLQQLLDQRPALDLLVMDLKLHHETSLNAIAGVRRCYPQAIILIMTAYASIATTVEAIKQGADDYLPKPVNGEDILKHYYRLTGRDDGDDNSPEQTLLSPKRLEWEHIQRALQHNDGNISQTAKQLNMHRRTLQRKLQKKPQL